MASGRWSASSTFSSDCRFRCRRRTCRIGGLQPLQRLLFDFGPEHPDRPGGGNAKVVRRATRTDETGKPFSAGARQRRYLAAQWRPSRTAYSHRRSGPDLVSHRHGCGTVDQVIGKPCPGLRRSADRGKARRRVRRRGHEPGGIIVNSCDPPLLYRPGDLRAIDLQRLRRRLSLARRNPRNFHCEHDEESLHAFPDAAGKRIPRRVASRATLFPRLRRSARSAHRRRPKRGHAPWTSRGER